jgi:penicillin-binding protein 1A
MTFMHTRFIEFLRRIFRRIAGYFLALRNPELGWQAKTGSAIKGLASLAMVFAVLLCIYAIVLIPFTPSIADIRKAKVEQPSVIMSSDGKRLAVFKRVNREWVELNRVSPHVISALIATEDHRFYEHHGVDLKRTASSIVKTLLGDPQGGSTITQQLARNLYPEEIGRQRTITRKLKEVITALKIEYAYSKKEILVTYLNTVPFLYNAFGIEMAARTYFDKSADKLSVLESATLIGMLKGTSYYNPVLNPERAVKRRNIVLSQMAKREVLTQANVESLMRRPMVLSFERQPEALGPAPHFAEHIRKWLINWTDRNDFNIYSDGLIITTTIDSRIQTAANKALERQTEALQAVADVEWGRRSGQLESTSANTYIGLRRQVQPFSHFWQTKETLVNAFIRETGAYRNAVAAGEEPDAVLERLKNNKEFIAKLQAEKTRLQAGLVAIDPLNAHVKAWVGSRDFNVDQYDHVAQAKRQPGSTFKPFVYGAALEEGMSPRREFLDQPVEIPLPDGGVWRPTDVSAPTGRPMTVRDGLVYSRNSITAQVMQQVGPGRAADFARKAGIRQSTLEEVPALALGTSPVTPLEMVAAYSSIATRGTYRTPVLVTRIADKHGNVIVEFGAESKRAMTPETADQLIDMLRGAVNQGTGQAIKTRFGLRADVAGKTGTTQNNTDGWFVLMHPRLVAGAWVGFNDARVTMRSDYWGQGANTALPVVGDFFQQALRSRLVDAGIVFQRPQTSVVESALNWFERLFGGGTSDAPPAPSTPPPPGSSSKPVKEEGGSLLDQIQQMVDTVRDWQRTYEREKQRLEDIINYFRRLFG